MSIKIIYLIQTYTDYEIAEAQSQIHSMNEEAVTNAENLAAERQKALELVQIIESLLLEEREWNNAEITKYKSRNVQRIKKITLVIIKVKMNRPTSWYLVLIQWTKATISYS